MPPQGSLGWALIPRNGSLNVGCHSWGLAVAGPRVERKLTAILAADVAGYSRLVGADEEGTIARLSSHRRLLIDPKIQQHGGRIVKTTGDGLLVEFASVVEAVRCAVELQQGMASRNKDVSEDKRIEFRVGINLGDVVVEGDDLLGDGVNVASRLEGIAEPCGICISATAHETVLGKVAVDFMDMGEQQLRNIARPVRAYQVQMSKIRENRAPKTLPVASIEIPRLSVVVLPFVNLGGDLEQEYFVDGLTENLTSDLSRYRSLLVIGRSTAFTYKGMALDLRQIGRDLCVRYVLEGSVQSARDKIRVNTQLIIAETGAHLWAEHFDRNRGDVFELQDEIARRIARALDLQLLEAEDQRVRGDLPRNANSIDLFLRGQAVVNRGRTRQNFFEALELFEGAVALDERNAPALAHIARFRSALFMLGWSLSPIDDVESGNPGG